MSSGGGLPLLAEGIAQLEEKTAGFHWKMTQFARNALDEWVRKPQTKDDKDCTGYANGFSTSCTFSPRAMGSMSFNNRAHGSTTICAILS